SVLSVNLPLKLMLVAPALGCICVERESPLMLPPSDPAEVNPPQAAAFENVALTLIGIDPSDRGGPCCLMVKEVLIVLPFMEKVPLKVPIVCDGSGGWKKGVTPPPPPQQKKNNNPTKKTPSFLPSP